MSNESKIADGTAQRTSKRTLTCEFRIGCPLNVYAKFCAEAAAINFQICRSPAQSGDADLAAEFKYLYSLPRPGCLNTYNFKPAHVIFLVRRKRTPSLYWGDCRTRCAITEFIIMAFPCLWPSSSSSFSRRRRDHLNP